MAPTDQTTPAAVRAAWIAAINARDAQALRPLLTDDYEVWANGVEPFVGIDVAVAAMAAALERITVTPLDVGPTRTAAQRALLILRCGDDGQWRFARGMTNALPVIPT